MKKFLYCLTFFLLTSASLQAQKVLAFENANRFKRVIYHPGSVIRFQLHDSKAVFSGRIESVNDSQIVILKSMMMENEGDASQRVFREYVSLDKIRYVYKRPSGTYGEFFMGMASGGLMAGGLMYVILLPIDAWLAGQKPDPTNLAIGVGMLATGGLMAALRKKKQKVGEKWVLKTMESITTDIPPAKE